jgi:hypothetical protein
MNINIEKAVKLEKDSNFERTGVKYSPKEFMIEAKGMLSFAKTTNTNKENMEQRTTKKKFRLFL